VHAAKLKTSAGFSIVEIMVGMTIGLITVLVVTQVMAVSESRRQVATSGADAMVNATLGLYAIERDGKNAGYGMTTMKDTVGCPIKAKNDTTDIELDLVPAKITNGLNGTPDEVRFLASSKNGISLPMRIAVDHPYTAANFFVESDIGVEDNDLMIAVPAKLSTATPPDTWCSVFQHASGSGSGGGGGNESAQGQNKVLHPPGQSPLNHSGGSAIWPTGGYQEGDVILNLGNMSDQTYRISSDTVKPENKVLQLRQYSLLTNLNTDLDLFPNIVQLQAVYGKDTSGTPDGVVDVWNADAPAAANDWQRISAIRLALVARSQTREPGIVTLNGDGSVEEAKCDSENPHPASVCWRPDPAGNGVHINVSADNPDWQRYRYRVVETTIPLRNIIWQQ
jgi:type IV pilus assembly protein PilW